MILLNIKSTDYGHHSVVGGRNTNHTHNNRSSEDEITLIEPERLVTSISTPKYANGYNVTCHFCFDGRVNTSVSGGVAPYSYFYSDGAVTANRTDMRAGNFQLLITDANGCSNQHEFGLGAPDQEYWLQGGNAGTTPGTQFIGTSDNKDLVFKSYANERLRIQSNGDIKINNFTGKSGMLYSDANGAVRTGNTDLSVACFAPPPGWLNINGQNIIYSCPAYVVGIGTPSVATGNILAVNGNSAFSGSTSVSGNTTVTGNSIISGNVGIGTSTPQAKLEVNGKVIIGTVASTPGTYKLYVSDGILAEKVKVAIRTSNDWQDKVFDKNYKLLPLRETEAFIFKYHHLPNIPSAEEVVASGVDLGEMTSILLQKIEELTLHVIRQEKEINELKAK